MVKKVAVVTESFLPQINGVTNSVIRVLETLKQNEIEAIIISPTSISQKHLGFEVFTTPNLSVLQFPVAFPSLKVAKLLDEFKPDVVHVAAPFMLGAQAISWAAKNHVPSVAIYQTDVAGYLERYNLAFARPAMEKIVANIHALATLNLAPTKDSAASLRKIGVENVEVWGRGVDLDLFNPKNAFDPKTIELRDVLVRPGNHLVGFVGRLAAEKQVHRMAELFDIPNTEFVVVGDGPERAKLEALFGSRVKFLGALTGLDLARAYAAMDVFVHFGTEETFGQTIQEAMATGLVVVAPDSGGPKHLINHRQNGFLVDHFAPGAYRETVAEIVQNKALEIETSEAAVRSVQGRSWSANNAKLLEYYEVARKLTHALRAEQFELA